MKRLFLLSAAVLMVLAGCTKNEVIQTPDQEITFSAPVVGAVTKAVGELDNPFPTSINFSVFGAWHENSFSGWNNASLYMDDVETQYDDTFNGWRPITRYYWPKKGYLTFAAYSPTDNSASRVLYSNAGFTFVGFKVENNSSDHVDLLYSERSYNKTYSSTDNTNTPYEKVDIDFHHALSSIQFTAKLVNNYGTTDDNTTKITLKKIYIYGVYNQADFNENIDETIPATYDPDPSWINHAAYGKPTTDVTPYVYYDGSKLLSDAKWVMNGEDGQTDIIVVPQDIPENATIVVEYEIDSPGDTTPAIPQKHVAKFNSLYSDNDKNEDGTKKWHPGKRYTYNLVIGLEEIYFAPEVIDWDDVTVTPDINVNY